MQVKIYTYSRFSFGWKMPNYCEKKTIIRWYRREIPILGIDQLGSQRILSFTCTHGYKDR